MDKDKNFKQPENDDFCKQVYFNIKDINMLMYLDDMIKALDNKTVDKEIMNRVVNDEQIDDDYEYSKEVLEDIEYISKLYEELNVIENHVQSPNNSFLNNVLKVYGKNVFITSDISLFFNSIEDGIINISGYRNYIDKLVSELKELNEDDILIISGGICFSSDFDDAKLNLDFLSSFKGVKIICRGSHDKWFSDIDMLNSKYDDIYFVHKSEIYINDNPFIMNKGYYFNNEFANVYNNDTKLYEVAFEKFKDLVEIYLKKGYKYSDISICFNYQPLLESDVDAFLTSDFSEKHLGILNYILEKEFPICYYGHLSHNGFNTPFQSKLLNTMFKCVSADYRNFELLQIL
ncbi:MAG: hypothetical protein ACK5LV_00275 [Lachnospirales bacterium]